MDEVFYRTHARKLTAEQEKVFRELVLAYEEHGRSKLYALELVKEKKMSFKNPPAEVLAFFGYVMDTATPEEKEALKKGSKNSGLN